MPECVFPVRILINTSILRFGGAVQVALSFIHECRVHDQHEYHVVLGPGADAVLDQRHFPSNFHFYRKSFGVVNLQKLRRIQREMSRLESSIDPDCVVTTAGPAYWRSRAPHLIGFNRPLFIYPESPYVKNMGAVDRIRLAAQKTVHCRLYKRDADALIVQTNDVNDRVRRLLGTERVYTVTNNYNGWFENPPESPPLLPARQSSVTRFLTVSSYYPHKNLEIIPEVLKALPSALLGRVEFVLTLAENEYRARIGTEIPAQVRLVGPILPPACPALYAECDAMFLPTLAECFSASYPEAMKMGKPILTTDLGFARSICQDAALYFRPRDARSAAQQIVRLIEEDDLRNALRLAGTTRLAAFDSPAERARKILGICQQMLDDQDSISRLHGAA